jgi:hypothetical protein
MRIVREERPTSGQTEPLAASISQREREMSTPRLSRTLRKPDGVGGALLLQLVALIVLLVLLVELSAPAAPFGQQDTPTVCQKVN